MTFTDPDDTLSPRYFAQVARFVEEHPGAHMLATRLMVLDDETGKITNSHPLRTNFRDGDVARRLTVHGDYFHGSAPSAFFRREHLESIGVRFDDRVQPNFEDGHFCVRYLLSFDDPVLGFVGSARYRYRRRSDGTSTLQNSMMDVRRFTDVPRYGYLDVIRVALERFGSVPIWLQHFLTYELSWYVSSGLRHADTTACRGAVADEFNALMREILSHIDDRTLVTFSRRVLTREVRAILRHGYAAPGWHEDPAAIVEVDLVRNLAKLSYFFTGEQPHEVVEVRGRSSSRASRR